MNHASDIVEWLDMNSELCSFGYYVFCSWEGLLLCVYMALWPDYDEVFTFLLNEPPFSPQKIVCVQHDKDDFGKVHFFDINGIKLNAEYRTRAKQKKKGVSFQKTDFYANMSMTVLECQYAFPTFPRGWWQIVEGKRKLINVSDNEWEIYRFVIEEDFITRKIQRIK